MYHKNALVNMLGLEQMRYDTRISKLKTSSYHIVKPWRILQLIINPTHFYRQTFGFTIISFRINTQSPNIFPAKPILGTIPQKILPSKFFLNNSYKTHCTLYCFNDY